jgi:hypothetical protein
MSPFIKDGDTVTVRPLAGDEPAPGDVVAFLFPSTGKAAVHRVVKTAGARFLVKGDNVFEGDGEVERGSILGIVSAIERAGREVRLGRSRGRGGALVARLSRSGVLARALRAARGVVGGERKGRSGGPGRSGSATVPQPAGRGGKREDPGRSGGAR